MTTFYRAVAQRIDEDSAVVRIFHPDGISNLDATQLGQSIIDAYQADPHVWTNDESVRINEELKVLMVGRDVSFRSKQLPSAGTEIALTIFARTWTVRLDRIVNTMCGWLAHGKITDEVWGEDEIAPPDPMPHP